MFTLRREGQFFGYPRGCCHCGPNHEPRWYQYKYEVSVYNRSLDKQGFVFDNQKPQEWFNAVARDGFEDSCELLARRAAYTFASWCRNPYRVSVCIVGFETAAAEYTFYCECLPLRLVGLVRDYFYSLFHTVVLTIGG